MITADGDSSHKIKRRLLLGRKATTNLDIILKSRDTTLLTKVRVVKALAMYVTNMNLTQLREAVENRRAWHALVHGVTKSRTQLNDYADLCQQGEVSAF